MGGCRIIKTEKGGVIQCNVKQDHKCNDEAGVIILDDGSEIPDTKENVKKYYERIRGGSVACSICGRAAIHDAYWM